MRSNFWSGFMKQAEANPALIQAWINEEIDQEDQLKKERKSPRVDSRELSESYTPDTWHRYWP